jgi:C-terminal processing protease CtpA/Prc
MLTFLEKMKKLFIIPLIIFTLFTSCRKDEVTPPVEVTDAMARDSLWQLMNDWYLWYKVMPSVNKDDYSDPYKLMNALRYKELDRWSFVADYKEFNDEMNGIFVGHGFRIGLDDAGKARIVMIYSGSQLYKSGVRRGWIVRKINDTNVAPLLASSDPKGYTDLIGPATPGKTNKFEFEKPNGETFMTTDAKTSFSINSVLYADTLHLSSGITGHLVLESFINPTAQELNSAFAFFKSAGVKDLILDLRYNSGGFLYIAQTLASYIGGENLTGSTFAKLKYNDRHSAEDGFYKFQSTNFPLNLTRLAVITTRSTASASEALMNGLRSAIQVVSIGDTTDGKPTGMNGWNVAEKYYFWPVTFIMVNSKDEGNYFEGFAPDKIVPDDITHDFGDRKELCLKEAIHYLETGSVSSKGSGEYVMKRFSRLKQFSEKPAWVENGLLIGDQK